MWSSPDRKLLILVLPALVLVASCFLMAEHGPFYVGFNEDPDYVYLFNSLLLVNFQPPAHIDHPGTTVQELGATVIFFRHLMREGGTGSAAITTSVLKNPEAYLSAIQNVIIGFVAGSFALSGWVMAKREGAGFAVLFQTLCIGIASVVRSFVRVSPEPFLFAAALLAVTVVHLELSGCGRAIPVTLGFVLGFGVATKITFVPLCLLIFILRTPARRLIAGLCFCVSCFLFTLPLMPKYALFLDWLAKLAVHKDRYGGGDVGVPPVSRIADSAAQMIGLEPLIVLLFLELLVLVSFILVRRKARTEPEDRAFVVGTALLAVQIALTLKHPGVHYLLPAAIVASWLHAMLLQRLRVRAGVTGGRARAAVAVSVVLSLASLALGLSWWVPLMRDARRGAQDLAAAVARQNCGVVGCYGASLPMYAMSFGNGLSRSVFAGKLMELYPGQVFYNIWKQHFYTFRTELSDAEAFAQPAYEHCMLFQGPPVIERQRFALTPLMVRSEVLYRVELPHREMTR